MAIQQGVWGIDLGQCALKALRLELSDGQITATAFDYVEHPKILSQPDADPDQLTREALEKFLERNTLKGDLVAISVPGQSGLARFVKLPPVEEKKIPDIVRFEAKQQIPFNLDEVVWDYQKIGSGAVTDGFAMETEIGLFAIKRDTVNRYLQHFSDVGVEVHLVQMSPLALCNFVSYDLLNKGGDAAAVTEEEEEDEESAGKKKCVVALDIGTDNSNLVITDGERIIWQRPIPLGGNHFTRALTKDLKLTFAKAEHLKRNATKSPDLKKILLALRPVLNDFVGEVQRSLSYFTNTHKDAHVKYMVGLGNAFRLPGLQKFLAEKLQLDVRKLGKMNRLAGDGVVGQPSYSENVLSFAVAYGLALQGLKVPRLQTNLLPHEIRVDRLIRAKKPWAVSAAAVLLFGTSVLTLGYAMQHRAVAHTKDGTDALSQAVREAEAVKARAQGYASQFTAKEEEIKKNETAVKSILAGTGERYNWLEFMRFLSEALPRPDGSNLLDGPTEELFWPGEFKKRGRSIRDSYMTEEAQRAFKKFNERQIGTTQPSGDDDEGEESLIKVNIVSVLSLYSDNLETFFTRLMADREGISKLSMRPRDREEGPKGKGWVVELRGYTYHQDTFRFIENTVVKNLAAYRLEASAAGTPPKAEGPGSASPTPTPPPAVPPPSDGQAPTAGGESKVEGGDPTWGKVSHVVLYRAERDTNPEGQQFRLITGSHLGALVGGTGPSGGGGGGGPDLASGGSGGGRLPGAPGGGDSSSQDGSGTLSLVGGAGGGGRSGWQPLGSTNLQGALASSASGLGGSPRIGVGGADMGVPDRGGPDLGTGGDFRPPTTPEKPGVAKKKLTRTEFVIVFVWREPTPSDELLPIVEGAADATGSGGPGIQPAGTTPPPGGGGGSSQN